MIGEELGGMERIAAIADRRREATAKMLQLRNDGEFVPPCEYECSGVIRYEHQGTVLIGDCPSFMMEPPCMIPERERNEIRGRMHKNGFPMKYLIEADWTRCAARDFLQGWLADPHRYAWPKKPGLLIHGDIGTGKTMAAVLVARDLWQRRGMQSRFVNWQELVLALTTTEHRQETMRWAINAQMLVLDDFGVGDVPNWVIGLIDMLFEKRNGRRGATIVTTNVSPQTLRQEEELGRTVDRWRESMTALAMPGRSLRG